MPVVTPLIILVNVLVFLFELTRGDSFVMASSAVPAQIVSGDHWITILTAMFMHGSWSHIIGNMVFLCAFGPEIEDAMRRGRYLNRDPGPCAEPHFSATIRLLLVSSHLLRTPEADYDSP